MMGVSRFSDFRKFGIGIRNIAYCNRTLSEWARSGNLPFGAIGHGLYHTGAYFS